MISGDAMPFRASKFVVLFAICFSFVFSLGACAKQNAGPNDEFANRNPYITHTVSKSGETLGVIAAWYTKRSANWQAIARANPGVNPNRIKLGQTILIPRELVVERSPMPGSFVKQPGAVKEKAEDASAPKSKTTSGKSNEETANKSDEPSNTTSAETVGSAETAAAAIAEPTATEESNSGQSDAPAAVAPSQEQPVADAPADANANSAAAAPSKVGDLQPEDSAGTPGEQPNGDAEREKLLNELLNE